MEASVVEDEVKSLQRIYQAVQRGDLDELSEALTHDIEWTLPGALPWGGTHHGHLGVQAVLEIYREHVEGPWSDPEEFLEAGDTIVVLGRVRGRTRSADRRFEVPFAHVWRLTDGMPSSFYGYLDTEPIITALEAG